MLNEKQTWPNANAAEFDLDQVMLAARIERARMFREFFGKLFRRQNLPVWNQSILPRAQRFSH